jgi:hypothetical protein
MADSKARTKTAKQDKPAVERRKGSLPQPDFTFYKELDAYPGPDFFFVGHSYHVDNEAANPELEAKRAEAIKGLFDKEAQWLPVQTALREPALVEVLSRIERDMLGHLPENALIGPALDKTGKVIEQSFTIWRREMRRRQAD